MTRPHKVAFAIGLIVSFLATTAISQPAPVDAGVAQVADGGSVPVDASAGLIHIGSASVVTTAAGSLLKLPPGYFFDEPSYGVLNTQTKILQTNVTSLTAQNASLRTAMSGWSAGWLTVVSAIVLGIATGAYLNHAL